MNDRELLELAAKAAGLNVSWGEKTTMGSDVYDFTDLLFVEGAGQCVVWSPLDDDGDALRLAMQLQMTLELGHKGCIVKMWGWPEVSEMCHPDSSDNPECTRRAIVRAAAQIGEVLP